LYENENNKKISNKFKINLDDIITEPLFSNKYNTVNQVSSSYALMSRLYDRGIKRTMPSIPRPNESLTRPLSSKMCANKTNNKENSYDEALLEYKPVTVTNRQGIVIPIANALQSLQVDKQKIQLKQLELKNEDSYTRDHQISLISKNVGNIMTIPKLIELERTKNLINKLTRLPEMKRQSILPPVESTKLTSKITFQEKE